MRRRAFLSNLAALPIGLGLAARLSAEDEAAKKKIHDLSKELASKDGVHSAETEHLMKSFKMLLNKVKDVLNTQAPLKAVGAIDELIQPYMD
jgi:hypothetical protein